MEMADRNLHPETGIRKSLISESEEERAMPAQFALSWTHYLVLMRIKDAEARRFYEIEAVSLQWTVRQLKRQVGSSLYERLALSRNKDEVMRLALEGQTVEKPRDMLKNPLVLEFLDLEQNPAYSETDLESAIIANLQMFLLELGKGFLADVRQLFRSLRKKGLREALSGHTALPGKKRQHSPVDASKGQQHLRLRIQPLPA